MPQVPQVPQVPGDAWSCRVMPGHAGSCQVMPQVCAIDVVDSNVKSHLPRTPLPCLRLFSLHWTFPMANLFGPWGVDGWSGGGMHDGAGIRLNRSILRNSDRACGARWGKGAILLHFQMRSFLVLTSTSAPIKQAGNRAILPVLATNWPHHKAPLRGAEVCADAHTDSVAPGDGRIWSDRHNRTLASVQDTVFHRLLQG